MDDIPQLDAIESLIKESEFKRLLQFGQQIVESPAAGKNVSTSVQGAAEGTEKMDVDRAQRGPAILEQPGRTIQGRYVLVERIGQGGMGSVWKAEQTYPIHRLVALKIIKTGTGTRETIARFEAERQLLALMGHANIARILDAGETEESQPFFVMELVQGQPLTTYCDRLRLSIDDRLRLFADVCSGVQHSHQKGIIHRDLKPSNILVTEVDGKAVPKVIDFGLAKEIENRQQLVDPTTFTSVGQILGTVKYMSPEQASLGELDIDTRADIYSLGVILYELLTGSTPIDTESIRNRPLLKVLESIRVDEAEKPSSRLKSYPPQELSLTSQ